MQNSKFTKPLPASGFSLVELMIVLVIISIVVVVGISEYRKFQLRAAQSAVLTNFRAMAQSISVYEQDYGWFDSENCKKYDTHEDLDHEVHPFTCKLVENNVNITNPFGISLFNSKKFSYSYDYVSEVVGGFRTWKLIATSNEGFMFCPQKGLDRYYRNHCGEICHFQTIDHKSCKSIETPCIETIDCNQ